MPSNDYIEYVKKVITELNLKDENVDKDGCAYLNHYHLNLIAL